MKFGVLQFFSWSRRIPAETVYQRAMERIDIMEQTGYDCVWLAEHHFNTYSICPSVHIMGTHVAARTKRMRIGTAVSLAGFYHPLRLAEEVALLDVLSGGRVNWGAGRGFDATEMRAFGVPVDESRERFHEAVEIVLKSWDEGRFTHHGKYWNFEDIEVLPKPLQRPKPPVWMAASSPDAVKWAGERGFNILMDPHATHVEIGNKRRLYDETLKANGHSIEGREIPMARLIALAPTAEAAKDVAREGAKWTVSSYLKSRTVSEDPGVVIDRYVDETTIHGTPEMVVDKILALREEIGLEYLMCNPFSHESFMLFTEKVLPKLL